MVLTYTTNKFPKILFFFAWSATGVEGGWGWGGCRELISEYALPNSLNCTLLCGGRSEDDSTT